MTFVPSSLSHLASWSLTILMSGLAAIASRKPSSRSICGWFDRMPRSSTTLPPSGSSSTASSPAALPIATLSPPMKAAMQSVLTVRSSTITGMPAAHACSTGGVSGSDSFGETTRTSTPCWTNCCTWLTWRDESCWASAIGSSSRLSCWET